MRGPRGNGKRRAPPAVSRNEATGRVITRGAPIGGWNTISALVAMPPFDCVICDNVWPDVAELRLRKGSQDHVTGFTGNVESLMGFSGVTDTLWGANNTGIYNVTNPGVVGAAAISCTNGRFIHTNFANSAGFFLLAVNGVDDLKLYNGTTWTNVNAGSAPIAITGVPTSQLKHVIQHKRRLWFLRKNSMSAYYLPTDAVGGALIEFPMGAIFPRGGTLVAQGTWTLDGGNGPEDYLVTVTTEGELAVYRGVDPSSASDWALVGVFYIGEPVSDRCFTKFGGDLLYLNRKGLIPLSKILQSINIGRTEVINNKIQNKVSEATGAYRNNFGWQIVNFPAANMLILNVPIATNSTQHQYCMNTITQAWARFIGWNANCFEVWNDRLFYGTAGKVVEAWTGTSDTGVAISGEVQAAYDSFGYRANKHIKLVRPNIAISGLGNMLLRFDTDFTTDLIFSQVNFGGAGSSLWDSAIWDSAAWGGDLSQIQNLWLTVFNKPGYWQSFRLRVQSSSSTFTWTSTDFVIAPAGIL